MAAEAGRQVTLLWDNLAVLGVREKGIELNGEPIDITSDEDSGWRTLLANIAAQDEVQISLSGVTKDTRLKVDWFNRTRQKTASLEWSNGDIMSGSFTLSSYSEGIPYNDAVTFEATLMSSGAVTYTPYS